MHKRWLLLILIMPLLAACSLFSDRERARENEPLVSGVEFGDIVMAEGIGADNAPLQVTNRFSRSQDFIYVVAEAERIDAGTSMFARWKRDGQPFEDSAVITADRDYANTYVEFHLENLQAQMDSGDYSVQLFVNGNPVEEVAFTVE